MFCRARTVAAVVVALLACAAPAAKAQDATKRATTYIVRYEPFKVEAALPGVFESKEMHEVLRAPNVWAQAKVLWAVRPGKVVKKHDVLVKLDTKEIGKRIAGIAFGRAAAKLKLRQAREELRLLKATTAEQIAEARRTSKTAKEDLEYHLTVTLPDTRAHLALDHELADILQRKVKAELDVMQKTYAADGAVGRAGALNIERRRIGLSRTELDMQKLIIGTGWREKTEVSRRLADLKQKVRAAEAALGRAGTMLEMSLRHKELTVAQMACDGASADNELQELAADRAAMTVRAPADGTVYYGKCANGRWVSAGKIAEKLKPGGQLAPNETFMTIVRPAALAVRITVAEKGLHHLRKGASARIIPAGYPKRKLSGRVESVSIAPSAPVPYSAMLSVRGDAGPVRPGMTCAVRLAVYERRSAAVVPAGAVFGEGDGRHVYVKKAGRAPVRRRVQVGRRQGNKLEILRGVSAGDAILLEKPAN